MSFVQNCWYPVAWLSDLGRAPVRRTVIGENLVLYRRLDGTVAALEDLCPHRMAPLSKGRLDGDAIECGYHGMTFDSHGLCIRVPGQESVPPRARVRAFPIAERLGLAWAWMGEAAAADPSLLVDVPQFHHPDWHALQGDALRIEANYVNLADNLCDPSHVSFVHASTLGNAASVGIPVQSSSEDRETIVWRWILDAPPIPVFAQTGLISGNVDRWHFYHYHAPCVAVIDFGVAPTGLIGPQDDRDQGLRIFAVHCLTPLDEGSCIDHWFHIRNFGQGDAALDARLQAGLRQAFDEDKVILEAIRREEERRPDFQPVHIAIDAAPTRMRRILARLLDAEREPKLRAAG